MTQQLPVAGVVLDSPLPHLDREFDYAVPAELDLEARPGVRVRVRFAGRLTDGFVVSRKPTTDFAGTLQPLRLVSAEVVLTPAVLALARDVAARWCGSLSDVLRLAVPPRHARAEKAAGRPAPAEDDGRPAGPDWAEGTGWSEYTAGPSYWSRVLAGDGPRAVWTVLPNTDWPDDLARAVAATRAAGRGVLVVVPSQQLVRHLAPVLGSVGGAGDLAVLTAESGPEARYREFLDVLHGRKRTVLGTRAAAFAPVADLGLVVLWDDGDDLLEEPRAPYPTVREVAALRSRHEGAAWLAASFARSAAAQRLVELGWAHAVAAPRATVRRRAPRVISTADSVEQARDDLARAARLPHLAWRTAREALTRGPVLVQVPRAGYVPTLACEDCRTRAVCRHCHGPLALTGQHEAPVCRWCGRRAADWRCPVCGGARLRALAIGAGRTAEELGRAFPGTTVLRSGGEHVLSEVGAEPAIVVATPGAEPRAPDGYAAGLLLDGWAMLGLPTLRAGEETLRRWMRAASLVRPASEGGTVVVTADEPGTVGALVRWDPAGFASRELAERRRLLLPPAVRMAALTGAGGEVEALLAASGLADPATRPDGIEVLGPVPDPSARDRAGADGSSVRVLLRLPYRRAEAAIGALRDQLRARSARRDGVVRVQVDPLDVV